MIASTDVTLCGKHEIAFDGIKGQRASLVQQTLLFQHPELLDKFAKSGLFCFQCIVYVHGISIESPCHTRI